MSFTKKINTFLNDALAEKVVDEATTKKLQAFAKNYEHKSVLSFFNIISLFGGIAIILGAILIVSHNWHQISNLIKISAYILILIAFQASAYLFRETNPKISHIIYFIVAGYILLGVGLISQIYHLTNTNGVVYLIWFFMILPMAILLNNKWISLMSLFGFYLWININANLNFKTNLQSQIIFATTISSSLILLSRTFYRIKDHFNHAQCIGYIILGFMTFVMGFKDFYPMVNLKSSHLGLHPITIIIIVFNAICLAINLIKNFQAKAKFSYIIQLPESIILVLNLLPLFTHLDQKILVSILYWITWFWGSLAMIYKGEIERSKRLINIGVWCIMIGLIARSIDLVGTMLFTGSMFMFFGIILIIIAYAGEKYRKTLINNLFKNDIT